MDYETKLEEIRQKREDLKNEYDRVDKERKSLTKGVLDDDTLDRLLELEDKLWDIHDEIIGTYDEANKIREEILDNKLTKINRFLKGIAS